MQIISAASASFSNLITVSALVLYPMVIAPPSSPSCLTMATTALCSPMTAHVLAHPASLIELGPSLLAVSEAFPTSSLWLSIMKETAAVCSQLLSRNDDKMVARPNSARLYRIKEVDSDGALSREARH